MYKSYSLGVTITTLSKFPLSNIESNYKISPFSAYSLKSGFIPSILYFDFLEIDVGHFRKKLLECMDSNNKKFQSVDYEKMLTPAMRRAFRWNFRYWESKYYSKYFKGAAA